MEPEAITAFLPLLTAIGPVGATALLMVWLMKKDRKPDPATERLMVTLDSLTAATRDLQTLLLRQTETLIRLGAQMDSVQRAVESERRRDPN